MKLIDAIILRSLASDERTARGLILAGRILVDGLKATHEGKQISTESAISVVPASRFRGALKLKPVIEHLRDKGLAFDCANRICADIGSSTGGFTSVLLEEGAKRVYAIDVAHGVMDAVLKSNERVVLMERTNARTLTRDAIPEQLERVVGDVSFISWSSILPALVRLLAPGSQILLLVKPQFELAASGQFSCLRKGIAQPKAAIQAVKDCAVFWRANGLEPKAVAAAGIAGARGNQEYFVLLTTASGTWNESAYWDMVDNASRDLA